MADPNYNPNAALQAPGILGTQLNQPTPGQGTSTSSTGPISSSSLTPSPSVNYQTPQYPPVYPVAGLGTPAAGADPYAANPEQQKATDVSKRLQTINDTLAGKAADTTALYKQQGFNTMTDANGNLVADPGTADLTAKLTSLQNEALSIPLSYVSDVQSGAKDIFRANTDKTTALRNNAIAALGVNTLIAAKNGQLTTAEHYINAALTQKYGPLEAELKAKTANLALIQNSPDYTNAEKKQAAAQAQQVAQQQAQLDAAKTNYTNGQAEVLKYAGVASAQQLAAMQKVADQGPAAVAQAAATFGLQQPQAGRYKDSVTTTTDAFGNSVQHVRIFDSITGQFVDNAPHGATAATLNSQSIGPSNGGSTGPSSTSPGIGTGPHKLSFDQYGLLANTDYNPNNQADQLANQYLDLYTKNGVVPAASQLGRGIKPAAAAQIAQRARDLYYAATGQPLPNPEIIKSNQKLVALNNKFLNNLNTQEGTVTANFGMSLENMNASDLNNNIPAINNMLDTIKYWAGDPDVAQYLNQNITISNEAASLLALRNATGVTVHDKLESAKLIDKGASLEQQKRVLQTILAEANNVRSSITSAQADLYKQIDPLLQDPNNPLRAQQQDRSFVETSLQKQGIHYDALVAEMKQSIPVGHQPALDKATGKPVYATPAEISSGKYIAL